MENFTIERQQKDTGWSYESENNHIEKYILEATINYEAIEDTIFPTFSYLIIEDTLDIIFSEPLFDHNNILVEHEDKNDKGNINYSKKYIKQDNKKSILKGMQIIDSESEKPIAVNFHNLSDLAGNILGDSTYIFNFSTIAKNAFKERSFHGSLIGDIVYNGSNNLIVQALNLDTKKIYYSDRISNNKFKIEFLPEGYYSLLSYEDKNPLGFKDYFSGLWDSYMPAAKFSNILDSVEVRARWDVTGITMEINN